MLFEWYHIFIKSRNDTSSRCYVIIYLNLVKSWLQLWYELISTEQDALDQHNIFLVHNGNLYSSGTEIRKCQVNYFETLTVYALVPTGTRTAILLNIKPRYMPPTCRQPWVWKRGIFWSASNLVRFASDFVCLTDDENGRTKPGQVLKRTVCPTALSVCLAKLGSCIVCKFHANSCVVSTILAWRLFRNFNLVYITFLYTNCIIAHLHVHSQILDLA